MTDALTNAPPYCATCGGFHLTSTGGCPPITVKVPLFTAAPALPPAPEPVMLKVECSHCHHMTNAGLVPLPPATERDAVVRALHDEIAGLRAQVALLSQGVTTSYASSANPEPLPPATGEGFPPVCGTGTHWFKQSAPGTRCVCGATSIPTPEPSEAMVEAARSLYAEVDCRIEHGADSGGHLEFVRDKLRAALAAQEGT